MKRPKRGTHYVDQQSKRRHSSTLQLPTSRQSHPAIALPSDLPLQQIATEDIGAFAAHVLANPEKFAGKRIDIAGDELSSRESADVLAGILGKPISVVEVPIDGIRSFSEDLALMYEWFVSTGYVADIEGLRSSYPEVGWTRFAEWATRIPAALT